MNELAYCAHWGEKLAARHPEDLNPSERSEREQHLRECTVCTTAYNAFHAMEERIRALPQAEPLPSLLSQLQKLPQEENSNTAHGMLQQLTPQQFWLEDISLITRLPASPVQTYCTIITAKCINWYSEVIVDDSDSLVCLIESAISVILADHFDWVTIEDVSVQFTPDAPIGNSEWDIRMTALGAIYANSPKQSVFTQQQELDGLEFVVEDKVSCGLLELFSVIIVGAVEIFAKDIAMTRFF